MLPVIVIVGRPNVGKSTLFNGLTQSRDALVADLPGVTRDRQYGVGRVGPSPYILVDTGGLVDDAEGIDLLTAGQVRNAIEEADLLLLVVDGQAGITAADEDLVRQLRPHGKPMVLAVNKTDGRDAVLAGSEFAALGVGDPIAIAASHRRGLSTLMDAVFEALPADLRDAEAPLPDEEGRIRLAIIGRPNVGKSTLVNRLLGEDRQLASDMPGTTRDTIRVPLERDGQRYLLLDTAGIRRRARVHEAVEKFSVIKALQAIDQAQVVVLLLDASEGVTDQDASLLGEAADRGRALVIGLNKWDGLDAYQRRQTLESLEQRAAFATFAERVKLSALHGTGIGELMAAVRRAYQSATRELPTPALTRVLREAYEQHQPPVRRGFSAKLRYAHSGGTLPPTIIIHGNRTAHLSPDYRRYLINRFRQHFKLVGTPLRLEFRDSSNPYAGRRNPLTRRQIEKKRRLKRHVKRNKR